MDPLIITAAVVGGELTKEDTPYLPVTVEEIAQESIESVQAGASIIHLHARDEKGVPKHDPRLFKLIVDAIKHKASEHDLDCPILQFSTGGSIGMGVKERIAPLDLNPDMATLTTGSVNFGADIFENPQATIEKIAKAISQRGIGIEVEIFDAGMIDNARKLIIQSLIKPPLHFNFVLGVPGALGGDIENLEFLKSKLPQEKDITWSVAGIGRHQFPLAEAAIGMGGHVRVGLEDNIYIKKGELSKGNAPLVSKVKEFAVRQGRPLADAKQAREILKLC